MAEFDIKITPRSKEEISNYKNFFPLKNASFKNYNGKIVFLNANYPDRHIYQPYYMKGDSARPLHFGSLSEKEHPLFTLQDLSYDDVIIYYTQEDVDRVKLQKTAKQNIPTAKPIP